MILTIISLPARLVSALKPIISAIKAHPQLAMYAIPLQRVAVVRVMQQLSRVYRYGDIQKTVLFEFQCTYVQECQFFIVSIWDYQSRILWVWDNTSHLHHQIKESSATI